MATFRRGWVVALIVMSLGAEWGSMAPAAEKTVPEGAAPAIGRAWAKSSAQHDQIGLGNSRLELWLDRSDGRCQAVRLVNHLSGRTVPLADDDFALELNGGTRLTAADFTVQDTGEEAYSGGQRLRIRMASRSGGHRLEVVYELGHAEFVLRRRLELIPGSPLELGQVAVWQIGVAGTCAGQGFGDPVLLDDTFWGLEFPAGHNRYASGKVRLVQHPGRVVKDRFVSKTAVLGVSEPGRVARRFQQYVDTFRVTPSETTLFVNYNTWWTLMPPTEANSLELIKRLKQELFDPYGESIDTFTVDDGWDDKDSLWDIKTERFPRGFDPLVEALREMNARLGIWLSPSSGYNHAPWLARHGYAANSNPWYICQSDPKYRQDIIARVTELAKQYDVAFFKFDGFAAACDALGHAHRPGPFAQEANTEAYIELLQAVRRVRPDIFLDLTCGIWLSPWWLAYADSLWGEVSGDYPDIIVPAPVVRQSATTTRDAVFRQRCREHPGFPPAAIEHLGIIVITPEPWEDNAMIVAGRGCRLLTLYINPEHFRAGQRDWAFLAALLKWVRHNARLFQRTELVLGDPLRGEAYGYAHFQKRRGVLALRNPTIEPKSVRLALDDSVGWQEADGAYLARIVYPRHEVLPRVLHYGDTLEIALQGLETLIVHVDPLPTREAVLAGIRCQETSRSGKQIRYAVFGQPGQPLGLVLAGSGRPVSAQMNGKAVPLKPGPEGTRLDATVPGTPSSCKVEGLRWSEAALAAAGKLTGTCRAEVPPGVLATMHVLVDPRRRQAERVECQATVNGKLVAVRAVRTPEKREQTHSAHPWTWFEFPLPEGRSEVTIELWARPEAWASCRLGCWLWSEQPLGSATLALDFSEPLPPPVNEPLPLPIAMERCRAVLVVRPLQRVGGAARWPDASRRSVRLDELVPDEETQEWGQVEANRSVWQKPLVIAGAKFSRGIGTHANGRVVYDLAGGGFRSFRCRVGRDEHATDGTIVFQVWVDGKLAFDSGPMSRQTPAKPIELSIAGAGHLELRTLDGGDGITGDHGDWVEAELIR